MFSRDPKGSALRDPDETAIAKTVQRFGSFAESDRATRRYYASLTPEQRLDILLDLIAVQRGDEDEAAQRLQRVYRIAKLGER